jgi:hypothetical protein
MYHLLVKSSGWAIDRDIIDCSRAFEYTDDHITAQFKPNGIFDAERITRIPALFASEAPGKGIQLARVGHIARVTLNGNKITIDYSLDANVPPISNTDLEKMSVELGISPTELSRTHWAIKDIDLFRILFRIRVTKANSPKVFRLNETDEIDDKLISVMMPFEAQFNEVYNTLKYTAEAVNLKCLRADDIWEDPAIIQDIVSLINRSRVIIGDCTGRNANVFYEIGIAHTIGREVILITQLDNDIPFDLRHIRYIHYLNNNEGLQQLCSELNTRLETILNIRDSNNIAFQHWCKKNNTLSVKYNFINSLRSRQKIWEQFFEKGRILLSVTNDWSLIFNGEQRIFTRLQNPDAIITGGQHNETINDTYLKELLRRVSNKKNRDIYTELAHSRSIVGGIGTIYIREDLFRILGKPLDHEFYHENVLCVQGKNAELLVGLQHQNASPYKAALLLEESGMKFSKYEF